MKKILTVLLIITAAFAQAQTTQVINKQTYYLAISVDTLFARQGRAFDAKLTALATTLSARQDQQQKAITDNQVATLARLTGIDTTLVKVRPSWFNPFDFVINSSATVDSFYLKNTIISK